MKSTTVKAEVTIGATPKIIALVITMLQPLYYGDRKQILKTVAAYFDMVVQ